MLSVRGLGRRPSRCIASRSPPPPSYFILRFWQSRRVEEENSSAKKIVCPPSPDSVGCKTRGKPQTKSRKIRCITTDAAIAQVLASC